MLAKYQKKKNSEGRKILRMIYLYCKCNNMTNKQTSFKIY